MVSVKTMFRIKNALTVLFAAAIACSVHAHHGSRGQFDHSTRVRLSGVVTDVRFVNPHAYVYLDVTNREGEVEPWRCEMRAGSLLKRNGWTAEMFAIGSRIGIVGSAARREEFGCYLNSVTFENGSFASRKDDLTSGFAHSLPSFSALRDDGTPNLSGNWIVSSRSQNHVRGIPIGPLDESFDLTEEGRKASSGFELEDNPRYQCAAMNIFHDLVLDLHVNKIEHTDDVITIEYGFMDIVRTIHLNMETHPEDIAPSRAGHSLGYWDDNDLVIDTVGFEPGYLEGTFSGARHSDQMHVLERLSVSNNSRSLTLRYRIEDPAYLEAPITGSLTLSRTSAPFEPYECEDLTEEVVEGF